MDTCTDRDDGQKDYAISEESMDEHKERGHMILAKMIMDAL